jgi:iron complex outermembrane receptor protein
MKPILSAMLLLIFATAYAQDKAIIKGNVKDAKTGEPLYGVNVYSAKGVGTTTDFDGDFQLKLDPGTYEIKISFVSYKDIKKSVTVEAGQTLTFNEKLESSTIELGTTVISASKYEKKLSEETVSIEVLGSNLIKNSNSLQADEAMEKVPGVTVVDGQASIRGGSGWSYGAGSRVAVMVDDMPFMSADAADAKWSAMPVEMIEQIEVIKGAASALYGSSALNGIINVRTAWPKNEPVTKITMTSGVAQNPQYTSLTDTVSEAMWYGRDQPKMGGILISHRRKIKQVDLILGGAYFGRTSHLLGDGVTETRLSGKIRYRPKNIRGLSMGTTYNVNNNVGSTFFLWNGLDSLSYTPFPSSVSQYRSLRINFDNWITYFDKNDNQFNLKTRYFNSTNTNNTGQGSVPQQYFGEFQYQRKFIPADLNIVAGVSGYYSWIRSPKGDTTSILGDKASTNASNASIYFQADKKFWDKLSISFGVRWEYFTIDSFADYSVAYFGNAKIPAVLRLGLNYQAAEATYIRASIGQGYRFPTIAEKFVNTNVGVVGIYPNPLLEPETGWSAEIAVKQGVKLGSWMGYVDLAGFINKYRNMMEFTFGAFGNSPVNGGRFDPTAPIDPLLGLGFSSQNVGNTQIIGGEFTVLGTGKLFDKIPMTILAGYTYVSPKNLNWEDTLFVYDRFGNGFTSGTYAETSSSTENTLKYRSNHTFKFDMELGFLKEKIGVGLSIQYTSFMISLDRVFEQDFAQLEGVLLTGTQAFSALKSFRENNQRGNTLIDPRISYKFSEKAKLTFVCKNALNQQIMERPAFLSMPRNYNIQLDIEF